MKKIINGKKYDTETAEVLGGFENGIPGNLNYCEERLYRKRTGEFFLYGYGGALTKYSVSVGSNAWSGGEDIQPLTEAGAKKWAEEHLGAEDYEKIFGTVEE